jgi:hypothetical protein
LAEFPNAWRRRNGSPAPHFQKTADFRRFPQLARCSQYPLHDRRMVRWSTKEIEMSVSFNLQKLALSVFGALVASSLFLTAALGPVPIV